MLKVQSCDEMLQVVQALLAQKLLREECGVLQDRVHHLEAQNALLQAARRGDGAPGSLHSLPGTLGHLVGIRLKTCL